MRCHSDYPVCTWTQSVTSPEQHCPGEELVPQLSFIASLFLIARYSSSRGAVNASAQASKITVNPRLAQLRRNFDSNDPFMTNPNFVKGREGTHAIPEWTKDDKQVQELLLRSFPKWRTSTWHREHAARWNRIIHLYYRMNLTQGQVAEEMNLTLKVVNHVLTRINKVAAGLSTNGRPRRPRGRKSDIRKANFRLMIATGSNHE